MGKQCVLCVRTSLPEICDDSRKLKPSARLFNSFEEGCNAMRLTIRDYAFSENSMFDGKGHIKSLDNYISNYMDDDDEYENCMKSEMTMIRDAMTSAFNGDSISLKDLLIPSGKDDYFDTDYMIAADITADSIRIYGYDDGPCNGFDPFIDTDIFSMEKEQDYHLYIDDLLGQDRSSELYIDLIIL